MRWRHRFPLQRGGHLTEEALSSRLDGVLAPREREAVDRHLAHCDGCRARLEGLERTVSLLRALPQEPVPRLFTLPEKASVPAPVRMTTPTAGSSRASAKALCISKRVWGRKALRTWGRLMVIFAIPSAFS